MITALLTGLDQYSKYLIVKNIPLNEHIEIIKGFFSIAHVRNYGAGFSIMQNQRLLLTLISILGFIIVSYFLLTDKNNNLFKFSYLLVLAGTLGNLIDRVRLGYVVDFLDFIIFGYDFPVFNVADSFITVGCGLLIIIYLFEGKDAKD